jgi:hypothetical protein
VAAPEAQLSPGRRVEGGPTGGPPTALERDVLRLLRISTTIADLALLCAVPRRSVEEAVEWLRLRGEPIVGGNHGLVLTEDPDELAMYLEARRRRLVSIYAGNRALRVTLRRMRLAQDEADHLTLWDVA